MSAADTPDTSAMDIKQKQAAYHDWEAQTYEDKFHITYDDVVRAYAVGRFRRVVPEGATFDNVLEIGAGTGFFLINLALGGCLDGAELHASDISEGMLAVCKRNAGEHGLAVQTQQGDAEALPYADDTFDLVIGHAFIHHLPVPGKALQEMFRVLRPGGTLVIAGEPTHFGDRAAHLVKRASWRTIRGITFFPGLRSLRRNRLEELDDPREAVLAALEHEVDLHTFRPADVEHMAKLAGFTDVRVVTEELLSNWVGWFGRTVEGSIEHERLGTQWPWAMFNAYRALWWVDERLRAVVPRGLFYNLILHGTKPSL